MPTAAYLSMWKSRNFTLIVTKLMTTHLNVPLPLTTALEHLFTIN